jgi:hypothetical protein
MNVSNQVAGGLFKVQKRNNPKAQTLKCGFTLKENYSPK